MVVVVVVAVVVVVVEVVEVVVVVVEVVEVVVVVVVEVVVVVVVVEVVVEVVVVVVVVVVEVVVVVVVVVVEVVVVVVECLTCTFRASCCSARLSRAQVPTFAGSSVRDRKQIGEWMGGEGGPPAMGEDVMEFGMPRRIKPNKEYVRISMKEFWRYLDRPP